MLSGPYFGVAASVAGLGALVVLIAENGLGYFPPDNAQPTCVEEFESWRNPGVPVRTVRIPVDSSQRGWFAPFLRTAEEPSLFLAATGQAPRGMDSVRFTWLRTFRRPIFVRIDYEQGGPRLVATELSGMGGYEPGRISRRLDRPLTPEEAGELTRLMGRPDLFAHAGGACGEEGPDGARWVLERQVGGRYDVANYWDPEPDGPGADVRAAAFYMMRLTGWDLDLPPA